MEQHEKHEKQEKQPRILLVEDEERLQRVLALTLEQSGYSVQTASTAAEAVDEPAIALDEPYA